MGCAQEVDKEEKELVEVMLLNRDYSTWRKRVVAMERHVLRALAFNVQTPASPRLVLELCAKFRFSQCFVRICWCVLLDVFLLPISTMGQVETAVSIIYFTIQLTESDESYIPQLFQKMGMSLEKIEEPLSHIATFYEVLELLEITSPHT